MLKQASDLEVSFDNFHAKNPDVYKELTRRVFLLLSKGYTRVGVKMVYESMRYDSMVTTTGNAYKLNNNYTAFYARKLLEDFPQLTKAISTRTAIADD